METQRVVRRKHSAEFRAQVVEACRQPGASVAAIALRNGLNANLLHRWLTEDGRGPRLTSPTAKSNAALSLDGPPEFVAVQLPAPAAEPSSTEIRIEIRRGASIITVAWPLEGASSCAAWLLDLLR